MRQSVRTTSFGGFALTVHSAPAPGRKVRPSHFLAPVALAILIAAVLIVVMKVPGSADSNSGQRAAHAAARKLPPYWTVRPGDTLSQISSKTGLTIAQIEAFNPQVDPGAIVPGQRLNLWRHPPGSGHPKPLGPQFWTVREGESLGSIANDHHMSLVKLESLNPSLRPPVTLQPGDRVKLR
jgi:LysM repeat protein